VVQFGGGPVPLLFNSVRLIPCTASEAIGSGFTSARDFTGRTRSSVGGSVQAGSAALGAVKDGFNRARVGADGAVNAIEHRLEDGGQGARDNRLLLQLGMLLGMGYLAFLTIWLWATRMREHGGGVGWGR